MKPLIQALKDKDLGVRREAAEALGEIGKPAVESLIRALKDKREDVREAAKAALEKIKQRKADLIAVAGALFDYMRGC